jgi:heme A synthase
MSLFILLLTTETSVADLLLALPIKAAGMIIACRFVHGSARPEPTDTVPLRWHASAPATGARGQAPSSSPR